MKDSIRTGVHAAIAASLIFGLPCAVSAGDPTPRSTAASQAGSPAATATPAADPHAGHEGHGTAAKPTGAPTRDGKVMTIVGEVMDPACFLEAGVKSIGKGHYQCAIDCARSGQTLAIYDRDEDRIYFIAGELPGKNPNVPLLPYIHKRVDVTGTVYHRADAWGIVILKVEPHVDKAAATK